MLDIPDQIKPFVNDYKIRLVEARENDFVFYNIANIAFFDIMKIILDKSMTKDKARKEAIEYTLTHNVDKTVIITVAGATNCKIDYNTLSKKGETTMYTLFDEIAKESKAEGKAEGKVESKAEGIIEMGLDLGLSENDILKRLQNKLNVFLQKAQEYFEMFGRQTV